MLQFFAVSHDGKRGVEKILDKLKSPLYSASGRSWGLL